MRRILFIRTVYAVTELHNAPGRRKAVLQPPLPGAASPPRSSRHLADGDDRRMRQPALGGDCVELLDDRVDAPDRVHLVLLAQVLGVGRRRDEEAGAGLAEALIKALSSNSPTICGRRSRCFEPADELGTDRHASSPGNRKSALSMSSGKRLPSRSTSCVLPNTVSPLSPSRWL